MEKYLELAARHGLHGEDALKFASERLDKDAEREERRLEREREREREKEEREKEREEHEREKEEREREREEREKQREEREKERKHELEKLQYQSEISSITRAATATVQTPKLPPFMEGRDEMDSYLQRFERFARAAGWGEDQWAVSLSALLTGKALDVYHRLGVEDAADYVHLKHALLKRYGLTADGYRRRLRESRPEQDETPQQFVVRLQAYLKQWIALEETDVSRDALEELMIREQFMITCPAELRLFLKERNLSSLEEMTRTAQQYLEARNRTLYDLERKSSWNDTKARYAKESSKVSSLRSASALQVNSRVGRPRCSFCEQSHESETCPEVERMSIDDRRKRLLSSGSCFLCLRPRHIASTCELQKTCSKCQRKHHELLCFETDPKAAGSPAKVLAARSHIQESAAVALQTARVVAIGPAGIECARVLIDSGSNQSFITKKLATKLGCEKIGEQDTNISTFGGADTCYKSLKKVAVTLKKVEDTSDNILTINVAQIETICAPVNTNLKIKEEDMRHLEELQLADPPELWKEGQEIDLLLGMDVYQDVMTGRIRKNKSGPIGMESIFGWILGGRLHSSEEETKRVFFLQTANTSDELERLWDLESIGVRSPSFASSCEEKQTREEEAVTHFETTCTRLDDGRYEVRWPKNENFADISEDDSLARARLERCEKTLERSGRLPEYSQALMQYIDEGYAERAPAEPDGPVHVLSHHAVRKNGKIRIVFDASAGEPHSLNSCVLPGPNLITDLAGILLRFRLYQVAVSADIEKAFLQISLHPQDRDVTRFLWRETPGEEPSVFRMTRVIFGVSASPFLLQATIKRHLSQYSDVWSSSALRLSTDLYCDDLLTSLKTEEEAENFIQETKQIFCEARMNMRKWASNKALSGVRDADCSGPVSLLDGGSEEKKVLGVLWARTDDSLRFDPSSLMLLSDSLRPTKRNILRISARIFDPLGLLTPFTVRTKMMLKQLWMHGRGWDDAMNQESQRLWLAWKKELQELEEICFPRPYDSKNIGSFQIHTFCDASQEAYAAAVYLRPSGDCPRKARLVMSKSRLAPTKPMCLARLELMAAVIGARLTEYVIRSLGIQPEAVHLWSDSEVALAWIRSDPRRWGTFVSNRVTEVQQKFPPETWRHCPGHSNPADLPSRGASVTRMQDELWQNGPAWLEQPETEWPPIYRVSEPRECLSEVKGTIAPVMLSRAHARPDGNDGLQNVIDINRFSSLAKLHRVTAWVLRWRGLYTGLTERQENLSPEEIERAEAIWLKEVQKDAYTAELTTLRSENRVDKKSRIFNLNPFLDNDQLMKVRGRIQLAELTQEEKHPVIMPSEHKYVELLALDRHQTACHGGVQQTLHALRERFWIPCGRKLVRNLIRSCISCKAFSAEPFSEEAAPLPKERVTTRPPFSAVGVDIAGPIYRKGPGSIPVKVWLVLFTCTVVRAIHLELVDSLSTEDFMKAFERFAARRGKPEVIFSDNGLNFKGGSHILATRGIKWKFSAQRAPWWGGFWERLIRMTKDALRRTLRRSLLTWEELSTVLCQIEAAINARPLTALTDDPEDVRPLSPQDFLHGNSACDEAGLHDADLSSIGCQRLRAGRKYRQQVLQHLWNRWKTEYLKELRLPPRAETSQRKPAEHDLVLIGDNPRSSRALWRTGIIEELHHGRDGRARAASVRTVDGIVVRPIQRLHRLEGRIG